jgi:hypothetical protein
VNFIDLPYAISSANPAINNVTFTPVIARFLRVKIRKLSSGPVGFAEISIHP